MNLSPLTFVGRHVRLEPLEYGHEGALLAAANAARSTFGLTFVPEDEAGFADYVATALAEQERGESIPFVVREPTGAIVGSTRFMAIEHWRWTTTPKPPVPHGPDAVEIGTTWYAERVQRTALNTEAKLLLMTHAFEAWTVRRLTLKTDERNARSRRAIERVGAKLDGVLRANRAGADGEVRATAYYSILASEWPAVKANLTARLVQGRQPMSES